ncbi:MAG: GspE/PulE family protein [Syntrophomonadales bacterium]
MDNRQIDLRIASMPTTHGEKLVIRVLDRAAFFVGKQNIGFSVEDAAKFDRMVNRPWGLVLVTGPTGSGKTTTLYSMLAEMDANRLNISTLEDPVEYEMGKITQTQINVQAGLTFVSGLRNMLRQDPDVVMVGEIRDDETADIAIRAALTGHLVLSTLHTNDAPGAVTRLMDMGIEPYLIASSLAGVIAQRLVRKICPECQEVYAADKREHEILAIPPEEELFLKRGVGCPACHDTGYQGRTGVFEILELDRELRSLIDHRVPTDELHQAAINRGMVPLWEDCRKKVLSGITTLEEALRVTQMY